MKAFIFTLLMFTSLAVLAQDNKENADPNSIKRSLTGAFHAISVTDGIDLYLSQGSEETVSISVSDEKYVERFKTVLDNGTLKLYYDSKGINLGINGKKKLKAYITFKHLDKLTATSGANVESKTSIEVPVLYMKFTSGSHFTGQVNINSLTVDQNSGSGITISGKSEKINVGASSASVFKGYDLVVDFCDAKASSGAGVHITVNKELNAKVNSGGGIRYKGTGLIKEINVNSGGVVKRA